MSPRSFLCYPNFNYLHTTNVATSLRTSNNDLLVELHNSGMRSSRVLFGFPLSFLAEDNTVLRRGQLSCITSGAVLKKLTRQREKQAQNYE